MNAIVGRVSGAGSCGETVLGRGTGVDARLGFGGGTDEFYADAQAFEGEAREAAGGSIGFDLAGFRA